MKKTILFLTLSVISLCGFSQMKFETVSATVNASSLTAYTTGQTVDSTTATCVGRFGVVGNPYTKGEMFTAYAVIKMTLKGDARVSDFQKQAQIVADAYRQKVYPDIK